MGSGENMRVRLSLSFSILIGLLTCIVDYILFIQADVDLDINPNEVRDSRYVSADELKKMFEQTDLKFTPWFKLICNSMLFEWWSQLDSATLDKYKGEKQIRRM